jgi:hypothetical protein
MNLSLYSLLVIVDMARTQFSQNIKVGLSRIA